VHVIKIPCSPALSELPRSGFNAVAEFPEKSPGMIARGSATDRNSPSIALSSFTKSDGIHPRLASAASANFRKISDARRISSPCGCALVDHGILTTAPASDGSAYQEYLLTPKGRGVFPVLVAPRQWSEEFSGEPGGFPTLLVDRAKRRPVRKLELRSHDGSIAG